MSGDEYIFSKGYAIKRISERSVFIPFDKGMEFVRNMTIGELARIIRGTAERISLTEELKSFLESDLIIIANDNGETTYLVVEIAFKAEQIHSQKATRYAQILEEYSGIKTIPVIASSQISPEVQEQIDSGQVYWHEVPDHAITLRLEGWPE